MRGKKERWDKSVSTDMGCSGKVGDEDWQRLPVSMKLAEVDRVTSVEGENCAEKRTRN